MKKIRRWMAALLILAMVLSGNVLAVYGEIPSATKEFYVNDYAGVFSDSWKETLCKAGEQLYDDTTAQLVVLTVDSTDGEDISDYAVETGRKWGIGSKDKNNGVLIVLAVSDREVWVAVGYGLEGKLTDAKTGRLLDEYAVPSYKEDNFEEGTVQLYYALLNEIRDEYGLEGVTVPEYEDTQAESEDEGKPWEIALGLVLIVLLMASAYLIFVILPTFIFVNVVLLLKGLLWKITGKEMSGYWTKNFSKMKLAKRLFNSLFPFSWFLSRFGGGGRVGSSVDNDDDYDSYDDGDFGGGGSFGGGGAGRSF